MADPIDSSLLPTVDDPPGQAKLYTAESTTPISSEGGEVVSKSITFDYSEHLDRIVSALDRLSFSMASIASDVSTVAANSTTIATKITEMEAHQNRIKELGETVGYRIKSPYEVFSMVSLYKLFVKEAQILELEDATEEERARALQRVLDYMQEFYNVIPREY